MSGAQWFAVGVGVYALAVAAFIWGWAKLHRPDRALESQWLAEFNDATQLLGQGYDLHQSALKRGDTRDLNKAQTTLKTARTRILQLSANQP